jgi:hypothetical protein
MIAYLAFFLQMTTWIVENAYSVARYGRYTFFQNYIPVNTDVMTVLTSFECYYVNSK